MITAMNADAVSVAMLPIDLLLARSQNIASPDMHCPKRIASEKSASDTSACFFGFSVEFALSCAT